MRRLNSENPPGSSAGVALAGRRRATEALADDEAHEDDTDDGASEPETLPLGPEVGGRNEPRRQRQARRQQAHPGDGQGDGARCHLGGSLAVVVLGVVLVAAASWAAWASV